MISTHAVTRTAARSTLALLAGVVTLASCTTISVSSKRYLGGPSFAPTDPNQVEILRREPRRPHDRVGEVLIEPSGNPSVADMERAIRIEAAKLGANAAVLVYDKTKRIGTIYEGPWWGRSAAPVYGRKIVAVAIHFK
jgi:hypothetical protein